MSLNNYHEGAKRAMAGFERLKEMEHQMVEDIHQKEVELATLRRILSLFSGANGHKPAILLETPAVDAILAPSATEPNRNQEALFERVKTMKTPDAVAEFLRTRPGKQAPISDIADFMLASKVSNATTKNYAAVTFYGMLRRPGMAAKFRRINTGVYRLME